ncbi:hypothetical protein F511_09591 [Dorcoceras hygrometricum]|uniref:UspA domain-containing protein n=1 Tax=Dorcoceras hygrometricum TaxID=472368 RepID=A0A2Z7CRJ8_9LAMI|nr:hypothetical protein F511_09591 [Dorcoceras hygrometricum]
MDAARHPPETSGGGASAEGAEPAAEPEKLNVLVGIDESDGSFYALRWALDHLFTNLATASGAEPPPNQLHSSLITLVNVQPLFQPFIYPAGPSIYIKAETLILQGDPKEKICEAAEQLPADLVVVGSRGLGTIKRALLGSVSNYCAHHIHCPVLIVKPPTKLGHE